MSTEALLLRPRFNRGRIAGRVILLILVVSIAAVIAFPYYWMIVSSLQGGSIFKWPPELFPGTLSTAAYDAVITKRPILTWFRNSAIVSFTTAILCVLVSINAGYAMSRFRNRVNSLFGLTILLTQMLPATLLVIPFYIIFRELKLLDNLLGIVLADAVFALPLSIWLLKGFFDSIPLDLEEQARVDGCSRLGAFYRITLPLALPGLVVVVVFAFMIGWDEYFFARTLITSESLWMLSVGLSSFVGEHAIFWNEMMAAAVIFTVPAALFFLIVQRYLVQGLTGGAVKG
jgi:multiple sugar transport system permease protein